MKFHFQYKAPKRSTRAVRTAFKYLGNRYSYGSVPRTTHSPSDCSGLIVAVYGEVGIDLPRTAAAQARVGKEVDATEMRPGDLIFFRGKDGRIRHVGIYIGDFKFIHASSYAGKVVISSLKDRGGISKVVRVAETNT
jgi:cell wall-associated NlpC family hydrolase